MGYRHYFYKMKKSDYEKISNLTLDELQKQYGEEEEYDGKVEYQLYIHDLPMEMLFEFGKLYWDDTAERIYSKGVPLFFDKDVQASFSDYEPFNVGEEGIREAIDIYINKVKKYYTDLITEDGVNYAISCSDVYIGDNPIPKDVINRIFMDAREKFIEWTGCHPVNTNHKKKNICNSYMYEYEVFELAHILKTFDFENNYLIFLGY